MHLVNQKSGEELRLQESTWSKQFHQAKFEALRSDGVSLENIVYYRSTGVRAPAQRRAPPLCGGELGGLPSLCLGLNDGWAPN